MVLLKFLGLLDIAAAAVMVLSHFELAPWRLGFIFAVYLIFKAIMFFHDFASIADMAAGLYALVLLVGFDVTFLTYIFAIYLAQKGLFSLVG